MTAPSTLITLEFDFTSETQLEVLDQLQQKGYSLVIFQELRETFNVRQPIWLQRSFANIFGVLTLSYAPRYKLYVRQRPLFKAGAGEANLQASATMTEVLEPGTSLVFQQNGRFTPDESPAPRGAFQLRNNTAANTQPVFVGLAASIDEEPDTPISTIWSPPGQQLVLEPTGMLTIGVARLPPTGQVDLQNFAPGVRFRPPMGPRPFKLAIAAETYAVVSADSLTLEEVAVEQMCLLITGEMPPM